MTEGLVGSLIVVFVAAFIGEIVYVQKNKVSKEVCSVSHKFLDETVKKLDGKIDILHNKIDELLKNSFSHKS